ncbi:conserved hypothetical protein [Solidesulfovibrio fructosivorans JJ]]|uniref:Uncharacterized protein n=1 Tax=Solidesulfovibrio fructosivorans JJ] TaxID=596151 RepID=E1JXS5_SOLFR|nr:hypothetical protein [Solidesulfovibrio fructosivorans]EFL50848.1 conserved hypothetical protein [Solidesulfovibrio fructosivorans JJ]]
MSKNKPSLSEDPFATIPPQEAFDAFPSLTAFPENAIAFLTGKTSSSPPDAPQSPTIPEASARRIPELASQPATQSTSQPFSPPDTTPVSHTYTQPASLSATPKANQKASQSIRQTQSPSKSQTKDHTQGHTVSHDRDLSKGQTLGRAKVADRLNDNQRRVLDLLLQTKPYIVKFRDIAAVLDMREASIRTIMRRLDALGFLTFRKARDGNLQGVRVVFNQPVIEQYQQDQTCDQSVSQLLILTKNQSQNPAQDLSLSTSQSQSVNAPHSQSARLSMPLEIDKKENLSIQALEGWDEAFLELMWPRVFAAGLRREQVGQASAAREKLGKTLERDLLALSLDRAEWELETKGKLVDLQTGEPVRSVPAYIFTALARWGVLRAHPEYVSREEAEAEAAVTAMRRRKEALETLENVRFEQYRDALTAKELKSIMQGFPGGSKDAWIKKHWRKNVRDVP